MYVQEAITRTFEAWMSINCYFQTEMEMSLIQTCYSTSIEFYPVVILNPDISSFITKVSHYFDMTAFSCQVQGSHLMERKKLQK